MIVLLVIIAIVLLFILYTINKRLTVGCASVVLGLAVVAGFAAHPAMGLVILVPAALIIYVLQKLPDGAKTKAAEEKNITTRDNREPMPEQKVQQRIRQREEQMLRLKGEWKAEQKPEQKESLSGLDESDAEYTDNEYYTRIAGVRHHCKFRDVGGFLGYAVPDPDNPHDRDAVAILRADDNKLLGFIPAVGLRDYKKWSRGRALPCVGYIREGQMLFGKVKVIDDDPEGTLEAIVAFVTWMLRTFGVSYKPDAITLDGDEKLTTAEEWIDVLRQALKDGSIRTMDGGKEG